MPGLLTNKDIARSFNELAKLMELHKENPFKIRSYSNAYSVLKRWNQPLADMSLEEIRTIPGIGEAISLKIIELVNLGEMKTLEKWREKTPEGVREMLMVPGLGPKKVEAIWQKLNITSLGDLMLACNENRLIEIPGFGPKTQEEIKSKIEFFYNSTGKLLYSNAAEKMERILKELRTKNTEAEFEITGDLRRNMPVIEKLEIVFSNLKNEEEALSELGEMSLKSNGQYEIITDEELSIHFIKSTPEEFGNILSLTTGPVEFLSKIEAAKPGIFNKEHKSEEEIFKALKLPFLHPEYRDNDEIVDNFFSKGMIPVTIEFRDLKGILHNHSTWSDGIHTLEEIADFVRNEGFEYFGISDHSKTAGYAKGLSVDRVYQQLEEINSLNQKYKDFVIYKGIESDILSDGSLDYEDEVLKEFDFIVASVHSNLNMDIKKATDRLIKAIENPYTRILGHPTGRLLLSREGYPIDHKKIIDACAENNVAIEINSNPYRLDIDWTWIPYAMNKSVLIAINPDAHNKGAIMDVKYGVIAARKGGLTSDLCLNSKNNKEFHKWIHSKK